MTLYRSTVFFTVLIAFLLAANSGIAQKSANNARQAPQPSAAKEWHYTPAGRWDDVHAVPRTLYHVNYGPLTGTPEEMARTYLSQNSAKFKMKDGLNDLQTVSLQETPGGHHIRFKQYYQGIPIYKSDVVVSINKKNIVRYVSNNYKTGITIPSIQASLSRETAIQDAYDYLQVKGKILGAEDAKLTIYTEENLPRLSYRVTISCTDPRGAWEIFVDAQTGEIFRTQDLRMFDKPHARPSLASPSAYTNGTGKVFIPDPLTSADSVYGISGFLDNSDSDSPQLTAQLKLVTLKEISLNGSTYSLTGPYVSITDWDLPAIAPVTATSPDSFRFNRSQTGFEDVNVYYNIDSSQRRIQELGFTNIQNIPFEADPHGDGGQDNSYYDPNLNALTFGQGGVDDAEDADVIWHEYGHAIQWGIIPQFGGTAGGNEEGMIAEGGADYWAGSYSRSVNPTFSRNFVFTWDAGFNGTAGTIWSGRPLNNPANYPSDGVSGMEVHDAGELWSSVLMVIWDDIGRQVMDKLVQQSYFYLGTFATMRDNAVAILQADEDLFGGIHVTQIATRFAQRNFLPPPQFTHTPIHDTENIIGPYTITAVVKPGYFPIAANGVKVLWSRDTAFVDSITLAATGNPNEYSGTISGNGAMAQYRYYLSVQDQIGTTTVYPTGAPAQFFTFYAGTDTIHPTLTHLQLSDQAKLLWPPTVRAKAKDNIGIDSVWVEFTRQRGNLSGIFPLVQIDDSTFEAQFGLDSSQIVIGDSIFYKVVAKDRALLGNITTLPVLDSYAFAISKIKILVGSQLSTSSRLLYNTLSSNGYTVDSLRWNGLIPSSIIPKYDLLIITAGTNSIPNISKRNDIIARVENGGRVWIEGGEVGSFFRKPDGSSGSDPIFRSIVLHDSAWINDASTSNLNLTSPAHQLFTTPNIISSPIAFTTTTTNGDRDAMTLIPNDSGATSVAAWSAEPSSAGIIIFTPKNSLTPRTIFFPFALSSITDSTVAQNLIENTALFFFPQMGTTDVREDHRTVPSAFSLEHNYPNPFNPVTMIRFRLPFISNVSLKIYDVLGREVATLIDGRKLAGTYEVDFNAHQLASGVYFYKLRAIDVTTRNAEFTDVKKMLLLK